MKSGDKFLLIRINSNPKNDFFNEHNAILKKKGYFWFLKASTFLVNLNITKIYDKLENSNIIIIRDSIKNKSRAFYCQFETLTKDIPSDAYPAYYEEQSNLDGLWVKIVNFKIITRFDLIENNMKTFAGNSMHNVLKSSANMVYFNCVNAFNINELFD